MVVEPDPLSEVHFDDPYEMHRRLRDKAPLDYRDRYGLWALARATTSLTLIVYHAVCVPWELLTMGWLSSGRSNTDWTATRPGPHIRSQMVRLE